MKDEDTFTNNLTLGRKYMYKHLTNALLSCVVVAGIFSAGSAGAAISFNSWEVASEFSDTSNPNDNTTGRFSYGYETTLNGAFISMPAFSAPPIDGWTANLSGTGTPSVAHNMTNVTQGPFGSAFVVYPPNALQLHPGVGCEYADVRFTAKKTGKYRISGQFYAMNYNAGTTTDVNISINGSPPIYTGQINYGSGAVSASFTPMHLIVGLQVGGTIDFQVGCGSNGDYFSDSTGLDAVIERK
jgi:hypothetical protein